ncbi:hypothetical protein [Flavobacterium soli]|uniref:hypothetical protein n=1 Tax=Flavobacterium soli TaxID=344881 RepID=UPI00040B630F|nr:hypothetical protein [Flavobacterium soli]
MKKILIAAVAVGSFSLLSFTSVDTNSDKKEVNLEVITSYENLITAAKEIFTRDEKTFPDKFSTRRRTYEPAVLAESNVIENY